MAAFDFRNTSDLRGSRFTIDEFKEGELWMTENRHFTKEMTYRFDESENAIQVKYPDGKEIQLLSNEIYLLKIKTDSSTLYFFRAEMPGKIGTLKLFQAMYATDKFALMKLPVKYLETVKEAKPFSLLGENYSRYKASHRYFLKIGNKNFEELRLTKKSFAKHLEQYQAKTENLLRRAYFKEGDFDEIKAVKLLAMLEEQLNKKEENTEK
jgi:hypothetical protein